MTWGWSCCNVCNFFLKNNKGFLSFNVKSIHIFGNLFLFFFFFFFFLRMIYVDVIQECILFSLYKIYSPLLNMGLSARPTNAKHFEPELVGPLWRILTQLRKEAPSPILGFWPKEEKKKEDWSIFRIKYRPLW